MPRTNASSSRKMPRRNVDENLTLSFQQKNDTIKLSIQHMMLHLSGIKKTHETTGKSQRTNIFQALYHFTVCVSSITTILHVTSSNSTMDYGHLRGVTKTFISATVLSSWDFDSWLRWSRTWI